MEGNNQWISRQSSFSSRRNSTDNQINLLNQSNINREEEKAPINHSQIYSQKEESFFQECLNNVDFSTQEKIAWIQQDVFLIKEKIESGNREVVDSLIENILKNLELIKNDCINKDIESIQQKQELLKVSEKLQKTKKQLQTIYSEESQKILSLQRQIFQGNAKTTERQSQLMKKGKQYDSMCNQYQKNTNEIVENYDFIIKDIEKINNKLKESRQKFTAPKDNNANKCCGGCVIS